MSGKANTIVGLDIGTSTIRVCTGEVAPDGKLHVSGVGLTPSRGLRKGVVINIESTVEAISRALAQAESMSGVRVESVIASLSGAHVKSFNSHGIVGIRSREVSRIDIDKVIEAARAVAIPMDREVLHVLPQEFIVDGQDGMREPLGISGVRLEARVHIVTGSVASGQNIVKCANRCGLQVADVVCAGLAAGRAVATPEEQELGVCVVDIGGGTTDICVFAHGAVRHTAVVALGGNHITNDIAAGLRTPIVAAEAIKVRWGNADRGAVRGSETIEVPSTGGRSARILSQSVLAEIIEPRVTEIFAHLQTELSRSGCADILTSGVVLTGGASMMAGIAGIAEQVLGLPVRVAAPQGVQGLTDLVSNPSFSAVIGLMQHPTMAHRMAPRSTLGRLASRVGNFFAEHF